jgi:hypothetical protein
MSIITKICDLRIKQKKSLIFMLSSQKQSKKKRRAKFARLLIFNLNVKDLVVHSSAHSTHSATAVRHWHCFFLLRNFCNHAFGCQKESCDGCGILEG